ncbi:hypothetical protein C4564_00630 [Candidatus Microgenomates bacterium]|nr:MAG: hypothetical protein C4564_00630 [Candidatus Microgenomates bacterium]
MQPTTIIIVETHEQSKWAFAYTQRSNNQNCLILALSFAAQMYLQSQGVNPYQIFPYIDVTEDRVSSYAQEKTSQETISELAHGLTEELIVKTSKLSKNKDFSIVLEILGLRLFASFVDLLRSFNIEKNLQREHSIEEIFIPGNHKSNLASYLKHSVAFQSHVVMFQTNTQMNSRVLTIHKYFSQLTSRLVYLPHVLPNLIRRYVRRKDSNRIDILFHSFGNNLSFYNHLFEILPRVESTLTYRIISGKHTLETLAGLTPNACEYINHAQILSQKNRQEVEKKTNVLKKQIHKELTKLQSVIWKTMPKRLRTALFDSTYNLVKHNLFSVLYDLQAADYALDKYNPRLLVATSDPGPSALPYIMHARQKAVTTLSLPHGLFVAKQKAYPKSKYIAVWGTKNKVWFRKNLLLKKENIFVVGFPLFDNIIKKHVAFLNRNINLYKNNASILRIGILLSPYTQPPDPYLGRFLTQIFVYFEKYMHKYQFFLRPHPYQSINDYIISSSEQRKYFQLDLKHDMTDFLRTSDLVISLNTTAVLQAMVYHKPLIHTDVFWGQGAYPLISYRAAWSANSPRDIFKAGEKLRRYPKLAKTLIKGQDRFLRDYVGDLDGKSANRHIALFKQLAKEN